MRQNLGWFVAGLLTAALWLQAIPLRSAAAPAPPAPIECPIPPYPITVNAGWYYLQDVTKAVHLRAYWQACTAETTLDTYPAGTDSLALLTADGRVEINHPLRQVRLTAANGVSVYGAPLLVDQQVSAGGDAFAGTPGVTATVALAGGGRLVVAGGLIVGVQP